MAAIPQINNPISGKGFSPSTNTANRQGGGELFDIPDLSIPVSEVKSSTDRESHGNKASTESGEFLPVSVKLAKDPTMAVESLKQLINENLLTSAKENGYTELYGELENLTKTLFLKPDGILSEILLQEKQNTSFSGMDFFNILRQLITPEGAEKATGGLNQPPQPQGAQPQNPLPQGAQTQNPLPQGAQPQNPLPQGAQPQNPLPQGAQPQNPQPQGAQAQNPLPQGAQPQNPQPPLPHGEQPLVNNPHLFPLNSNITSTGSTKLDNLKTAAGNLLKAIQYVGSKDEILSALSSNLKFLSKYFAPNKLLSERLEHLSAEWAKPEAAENFTDLKNETQYLLKNVSESLLNNEHTQVLIPLITHNLSRYNTNKDMLSEYFMRLSSQITDREISSRLETAFKQVLSNLFGEQTNIKTNNSNYYSNDTINQQKNQDLNSNFHEKSQIPEFLSENLGDKRYLSSIEFDDETINSPVRSYLLGKTDGKTAIGDILSKLIIVPAVRDELIGELERIDNIGSLVDYLNDILRSIPDIDERQTLFEGLVEIINSMAETKELPPGSASKSEQTPFDESVADKMPVPQKSDGEKQSVMKPLVEFIEKNIDHSALKTINNYNASNLLQSLINAPGVMTPLAHYIVPLQIDDIRAFGELWVDKDSEESAASVGGAGRNYHLFLTFEVEEVGRFEVDLIASGQNVNLSLLYPESYKDSADALSKKVNRFVAQSGYTAKSFRAGVLKKPHNLTEVFPSLTERRTGFNVKA